MSPDLIRAQVMSFLEAKVLGFQTTGILSYQSDQVSTFRPTSGPSIFKPLCSRHFQQVFRTLEFQWHPTEPLKLFNLTLLCNTWWLQASFAASSRPLACQILGRMRHDEISVGLIVAASKFGIRLFRCNLR